MSVANAVNLFDGSVSVKLVSVKLAAPTSTTEPLLTLCTQTAEIVEIVYNLGIQV